MSMGANDESNIGLERELFKQELVHNNLLPKNTLNTTKDTLSKMKILVVDDMPGIASNFCELLSSVYDCEYAVSATEALNLARVTTFDVVLTDFNMPEMDGVVLCREILKFCPIYALIFTGSDIADTLKHKYEFIHSVLRKPIDFMLLLQTMSNIDNDRRGLSEA